MMDMRRIFGSTSEPASHGQIDDARLKEEVDGIKLTSRDRPSSDSMKEHSICKENQYQEDENIAFGTLEAHQPEHIIESSLGFQSGSHSINH